MMVTKTLMASSPQLLGLPNCALLPSQPGPCFKTASCPQHKAPSETKQKIRLQHQEIATGCTDLFLLTQKSQPGLRVCREGSSVDGGAIARCVSRGSPRRLPTGGPTALKGGAACWTLGVLWRSPLQSGIPSASECEPLFPSTSLCLCQSVFSKLCTVFAAGGRYVQVCV